jgi:valyl-tRNA synthetase
MSQEKRELASAFVPSAIEGSLYQKWIDAGYFTADAASSKEPFTIVIPPPNVTGNLHIGHALDQTLQDCLTRLKRMQGYRSALGFRNGPCRYRNTKMLLRNN